MSLLYDKVVHLINKPPEDRNDTEIDQILPWFTKKSDLFKSLHTDIVRDIVKNCKFVQYKLDNVILRQMDQGDCFYIILSGTVAIVINTTLTEEEYPQIKEAQLAEEEAWEKDTTGRRLDRSKYGQFVGKIDAGKSFGELALINADCVRNATIIADETTDLLYVDRDLYNRSLRAFQVQDFEQRKEFVRTFPMFHNWAPRYRKMMAYSLKKQVLRFEDTIVRQGATVDGIYFIVKGSVKIRVDPTQHPNQYPQLYPLGNIADLEKEKARELLRKEMNLERRQTPNKRSIYHRRTVALTDLKKVNQKSMELCFAGAIDVIGDLEMAVGLTSYSETVECMEESIVYHLDQRNYDRLIEKRNPAALEMLKDIVHTKLSLHFSRLHDDAIPLYRYFLYTLDEKEKDARRATRMPRNKTPQEMAAKIENLQKGPLVNMYGPGSVFYLIRKRAKEMRKRQRRRGQNNPAAPVTSFRLGIMPKATPMAMVAAAQRGVLAGHVYHPAAYQQVMGAGDGDDQGSPTASMINFYGAQHDPQMLHGVEEHEFGDDSRRSFYNVDGYEQGDLDFDEYHDRDTSDTVLSELEKRLSQWHSSLPTVQKGTCVVPLHRYQMEDENKPKPGNKIYVRLRNKQRTFFAFQNPEEEEEDALSSPEGGPKPSIQTSRSPISSCMPLLETIVDRPVDVMSEIEERPKGSMDSQRPKSTRSEPARLGSHTQKKRKQYTAAEYQALKAELRRRQKAWVPMLPNSRSATVM